MVAQRQQPNPTRRAVPRTARTTAQAFQILEADQRNRLEALAEALAQGRIDLDAFADAMQTELRRYHLATAVLGAGGANQMVLPNFEIAEKKAIEQVGFLNRWVDEMRRGDFPLDAAPRVRQRAKLYAGAGNATFSESRAQRFGIPPLGQYPGDGQHSCKTNCKCDLEYQQVEGGFDVYWRTNPNAEHCPDCEAQARRWSPLRIRNGAILE